MALKVDVWPYVFKKPGPRFEDSDSVKFDWAELETPSIRLVDYPVAHEMLGFVCYFTGPFSTSSPLKVGFRFLEKGSGVVLFEGVNEVPTPGSQGFDWWEWYKIKGWIGHAGWEVSKGMVVVMEVVVSLEGVEVGSFVVDQLVEGPPEAPRVLRRITGKVTDVLTGLPVVLAGVNFGGAHVVTGPDGVFVIDDPDPITSILGVVVEGYRSGAERVSSPVEGELVVDFKLLRLGEELPSEPPVDFVDRLKGFLRAVLVEGLTVQDALVRFDIVPVWLGNVVNQFLDFFTVNVAPEGERPVRLLFFGGGSQIAKLPKVTISAANGVIKGLEEETWLKAIDIMKLNPLKYKAAFLELPEAVKIKVLQTLRKDVAGVLARDVFGKAFSEELLAKAPLWKRALFSADKHKFNGFYGLVALAGSVIGIDLWGNWSIIDNLQFLSHKESMEIQKDFKEGKISRDEALKELRLMLAIAEEGDAKVRSSTSWNFMQMIFAPVWDDLSAQTVKDLRSVIGEIERAEAPPKFEIPSLGTLKVGSNVVGSDVFLDGLKVGLTPYEKLLQSGLVHVLVTKFGYTLDEADVEVLKDKTASFDAFIEVMEAAPPGMGTLDVSSDPSGAQIIIKGEAVGVTPEAFDLDPGSYAVTFKLQGYKDKSVTGIVRSDEISSVSVVLEKVSVVPPEGKPPEVVVEKATITIKSEPSNSDVYIDGNYTFTKTPYTAKLDPGVYVIRCQTSGYLPQEVQITLEEAQVGEVVVKLEKIPDVVKPKVPYDPFIPYLPEQPTIPKVDYPVLPEAYADLPEPGYNFLDPPPFAYDPDIEVQRPLLKELIVNVETTDLLPFQGRVISIAWIDLSDPQMMAKVITSDDEQDLINTFLDFFDSSGFTRVVGYNVSFDHRYIFTKSALYRRAARLWAGIETRDVMQILQQVKETFVYGSNKPGTLDEWGKHLLGRGKFGPQEEVLQRFIRKDFDYIDAFNIRQVELTRDLYQLLRFTLQEAVIIQATQPTSFIEPFVEQRIGAGLEASTNLICPNCLQGNHVSNERCIVCGMRLNNGKMWA